MRWVTHHQLDNKINAVKNEINAVKTEINNLDHKFTLWMTIMFLMVLAFGIIFRNNMVSGMETLDKNHQIQMLEMENRTKDWINESNMAITKKFWQFKQESDTMNWKEIEQKFYEQDQKILQLQQERAQRAKRLNKSAEELV